MNHAARYPCCCGDYLLLNVDDGVEVYDRVTRVMHTPTRCRQCSKE